MNDKGLAIPLRRLVLLAAITASVLAQSALGATALDRARGFVDSGDLRSGMIELKSILQADPGDVEARLLLGRIYLELRQGAAAEKEIRRAMDLGAAATEWRLDLAEARLLQNEFSDALDRLEEAEGLSGEDASRALGLRGIALAGLGRPDEAEAAYVEALSIDPGNQSAELGRIALATSAGDVDRAIALTDALLQRTPESVEALLIRAGLYRNQKDLEKAAELFSRVIDIEPKNMNALLGRSAVLIGQNDVEGAVADLNAVDAVRKDLPMTLYLRGVTEFLKRDWPAARDYMQQVLAVQPHHLPSKLIYGIVSYSEGDYEIADEYLGSVVNAMPRNLQAIKALGATRIKMREPERAIEILLSVADSGDAQILSLLGSAHMLSGDREAGQQWLSRAVEAAPDVASVRTQLALTMLAGGQTGEAIDELHSAVDLGQDIFQADLLLVLAHLKNKEFDQALAASAALEERMPDNPIAYNLTGLALMSKGDLEAAAARFNKALELDPEFVTAEINLARLATARNDLEAAEAYYDRVLRIDPNHLGALLGRAALAERRGDNAEIVRRLERAQNANTEVAQPGMLLARHYIQQGDIEKGLAVAKDLASRFPKDKTVHQLLGKTQTLVGDVDDAVVTFRRLVEDSPEDPELYYLLGAVQWKAGDHARAEQSFHTAISLKPDFVGARFALATAYLDSGRADKALAAARQLQQDYPDSTSGYRIEGAVHQRQREFASAVAAFEKLYAVKKGSSQARLLADAYAQDNRLDEAIATLSSWVAENQGDQAAMVALAMLYQRAARGSEALKLYEELVASGQNNSVVLNNMAWLLYGMGDERALAISRQAYDGAPNRAEIVDTYGWILFKSGKKEEGLSILQQAYLSFPGQPEIGYHVAVALADLGRKDEAVGVLQRSLESTVEFDKRDEAVVLLKKLGGG